MFFEQFKKTFGYEDGKESTMIRRDLYRSLSVFCTLKIVYTFDVLLFDAQELEPQGRDVAHQRGQVWVRLQDLRSVGDKHLRTPLPGVLEPILVGQVQNLRHISSRIKILTSLQSVLRIHEILVRIRIHASD
jgi:hypothetical protein